jgi:hypothetical protein
MGPLPGKIRGSVSLLDAASKAAGASQAMKVVTSVSIFIPPT